MSWEPIHLAGYSHGEPCGTVCGKSQSWREAHEQRVTGDPALVTCAVCKQYVKRSGDGPESLKSLLRF